MQIFLMATKMSCYVQVKSSQNYVSKRHHYLQVFKTGLYYTNVLNINLLTTAILPNVILFYIVLKKSWFCLVTNNTLNCDWL